MEPEILLQSVVDLQAPVLAELHLESFGKAAWNLNQIQGSLALETTQGWIAYTGNDVCGFLLCQMTQPESEILTFCVRPCYRHRGIGEKLLERTIEANRAQGSQRLFLEVASDNKAALGLYEKCGFKITGTRPQYYQRDDGMVDAILLTLTISPP